MTSALSAPAVLALQRTAGNRAVAARIAATPRDGGAQIARWPNLSDFVEGLRGTTPPSLADADLVKVAPARIARLDAVAFATFTGHQLGILTRAQVAALTPVHLGALTGAQAAAVEPGFIENLPRPLLQHVPNAFLTGLSRELFAIFSPPDLDGLTPMQLGALTRTQLGAIGFARLPELSAQVLTGIQLARLPDPHVSALTPAQIAALGNNVAQFSATQVPRLTAPQLHALSDAQVSALTQQQISALTDQELHALMPRLAPNLVANHPRLAAPPGAPLPADPPLVGTLTGPVRLAEFKARTPDDVKNAAGPAIAALTEQDCSEFTAAHVAELKDTHAPHLLAHHLRALPPAHIGRLPGATFRALGDPKRAVFTADHVRNLTAAQIGALTAQQERAMPLAQIAAFLPVQLASFDADLLQRWTDDQRRALTPDQFGSLRREQLQVFNGAQIGALRPEQVGAVPPARFRDLIGNVGKFNALTVAQLQALSPAHLAALPQKFRDKHPNKDLLPAVPATPEVAKFGPAAPAASVPNLPISQVRGLPDPHARGMPGPQIAALTAHQIPALAPASVGGWTAVQVQALGNNVVHLSVEQLRAMDGSLFAPAQVALLTRNQLSALPSLGAQAAHLTPNQIPALLPGQVDAVFASLSAAAMPGVTPTQVPAIGQPRLAAVPQAPLQAMTRVQFAALQEPQVAELAQSRIEDITAQQFGWLAPRLRSELVTTIAPHTPARVGPAEFRIDPALRAQLPGPLQALLPPSVNPAAPPATRKETLWALLPDDRRQAFSSQALPGALPGGWNNLITQLRALHPAFSVMTAAPAAPAALSAMFAVPAMTMASAVRNALVAGGFPYTTLHPMFSRARHGNWAGNLPGPTGVAPPGGGFNPVAGTEPYLEFDIYPRPNQVGLVGLQRGVHRIVVGINVVAGPHAGAAHLGVGRWFYTPDHYHTFIEF